MRTSTNSCSNFARLLAGVVTGALLAPQALALGEDLDIFACEPEYAALARELAPEASIFSATTALQDQHQVQARPSLIAKMRRAELVICAGAELEVGWLPMLQMKANNPDVRDGQPGMFYAADHVETLDKRDKVDRSEGDVHAEGNPHLHFSPSRILSLSEALARKLGELDPTSAEDYQGRQAEFAARWQLAVDGWQQQGASLAGTKVIAYHSSFRYLFDWLKMEQVGDLEPKPGLPPTTGHLTKLLQRTRSDEVSLVIHAGYQDERGAEWLAQRAGLPRVELPMGPGIEGIDDLFALYDTVLKRLLAAVGQ